MSRNNNEDEKDEEVETRGDPVVNFKSSKLEE